MRRFVGAFALAVALCLSSVNTRGDTVGLEPNAIEPRGNDAASPTPFSITPSEAPVSTRPAHSDPSTVPLPGAAWTGMAMMTALLIGRHMIRRRRRLV